MTIDSNDATYGILIRDSTVPFIIRNCTLYDVFTGSTAGNLRLYNTDNGVLFNNTCYDGRMGVMLESSSTNNTIEQNTAHSHTITGIHIASSNDNRIVNNTVYNLSPGTSYRDLALISVEDLNITYNTLLSRGIYLSGNNIARTTTHRIDTTNTVGGKPIYYYANSDYLTSANFSNAGQILIANSDHSILNNLNFTAGSRAISLYICENTTIIDCNFTNSGRNGIYLDSSINNRIVNNSFKGNEYGLDIYDSSSGNNVTGNFFNDTNIAVYTYLDCDSLRIENNTLGNCVYGMYLYSSENCTIRLNLIDGSLANGIILRAISGSNNFSENSIINCASGISIREGSNWNKFWENLIEDNTIGFIIDDVGTDSSVNTIFNNTFNGNTKHAQDDCPGNFWNNSIIGNSWDNTTDADDNGVPDTLNPYPISGTANAMDYLPWRDDGDDVAPTITVNSPINNFETETAPIVNVSFYDYYELNDTWYQYLGLSGNLTLAGNGTFQVDTTIWNQLDVGEFLNIRFYANDSSGQLQIRDLSIKKSGDDPSNGTPPPPSDPGLIIIIGVIIGAVAVVGVVAVIKLRGKERPT